MMCYGADQPVVLRHDAKSLFQGGFLIAGSHSFIQIIDNRQMGIVLGARFLHNTDAPVEIGRKTIFQVVGLYQRMTGKECLMAD